MENINRFVGSMKNGDKNFVLTDEGDINKFLGIEITQLDDKRFKISLPYLIDLIIYFLNIDANDHNVETNEKSTPVGKPLLHKYLSGNPRKKNMELSYSCWYDDLLARQYPTRNVNGRASNHPFLQQPNAIAREGN